MAIVDEITRLQNAKEAIKTSIENKGVEVGEGTIDTYAEKIDQISTGGEISAKITDATSLFANGLRTEDMDGLLSLIGNGCTIFKEMFNTNRNVTSIPNFNTSGGINFSSMFNWCTNLVELPEQFDTSNGTNLNRMFNYCQKLTKAPTIDTSNATNIGELFASCILLEEIPTLNTSKTTTMYRVFYDCKKLTEIPELDAGNVVDSVAACLYNCKELTTFGGLKNLGKSFYTSWSANMTEYKFDLSSCTLLTYDSLMNVINNLYDIASIGVQPQSLILGETNLAKLTEEEILIATLKGWNVT